MMGRNRDGFALLTVLAALALLSTASLLTIAEIQRSSLAAENRAARTRAYWTASACVEWLRAETETRRPDRWTFSRISLGAGVRCRIRDLDPSLRRHLGLSDSAAIASLVGVERTSTYLDWVDADTDERASGAEAAWYRAENRLLPPNRAMEHLDATRFIRGWPDPEIGDTRDLLTMSGDGRVDVNRASPEVLRSVTELAPHRVERILTGRAAGVHWRNAAELLSIWEEADSIAEPEAEAIERVFIFAPPLRQVEIIGEDTRSSRTIRVRWVVTLRELSERVAVSRVVAG